MSISDFIELSFPVLSSAVFDKMLWTDWYDGITSGLVVRSVIPKAFKLDIIAWGLGQQRRAFVLSSFELPTFDRVVVLLSSNTAPTWPKWDPAWPSRTPENEQLIAELDRLLGSEGKREYVLISDASFGSISGLRELDQTTRNLLPPAFDGLPSAGSLDYWEQYVMDQ